MRPSVAMDVFPARMSIAERYRAAAAARFEGVEEQATFDRATAETIRTTAIAAGLQIHLVSTPTHWSHPLSSPDRRVVDHAVQATICAMENALLWDAKHVLIVPGRVNNDTSYADAYQRSHDIIARELVPIAQRLGVTLLIENVNCGFLLSPLEFVRYVDDFGSASVRCLFDIGNVPAGHPEYWIPIVGHRLANLHLKDFTIDRRTGKLTMRRLGFGIVRWDEIARALAGIGYQGWATVPFLNYGLPSSIVRRLSTEVRTRLPARPFRLQELLLRIERDTVLRSLTDAHQRYLTYACAGQVRR